MHLSARPLDLPFAHPFGIARGTKQAAHNVLVEWRHEGLTGLGEGAPNLRYGETQASALAFLNKLNATGWPALPGGIEEVVSRRLPDSRTGAWSARAAVDLALHDWWGKRENQPLFRLWGLADAAGPVTSFTIGLDTPDVMRAKTEAAAAYAVLKIKLGTPGDRVVMAAVRSVTDKPLRVDANEGWATKEEALGHIEWLAGQGVELVEQPLPANRHADMVWLKRHSPLPLFADEDAVPGAETERLAEGFHGLNIKVDKCGGLLAARRLLDEARRAGLLVMLGCMGASSLAITGAAHLSPLADYADLDGHLLLADDPFEGVRVLDGRLVLPERPGLGVLVRSGA